MISCVKELPLCHYRLVGFKIKIGFELRHLTTMELIKYYIHQHRVESRVLIFGAHGNKSKVDSGWLFRNFKNSQ